MPAPARGVRESAHRVAHQPAGIHGDDDSRWIERPACLARLYCRDATHRSRFWGCAGSPATDNIVDGSTALLKQASVEEWEGRPSEWLGMPGESSKAAITESFSSVSAALGDMQRTIDDMNVRTNEKQIHNADWKATP